MNVQGTKFCDMEYYFSDELGEGEKENIWLHMCSGSDLFHLDIHSSFNIVTLTVLEITMHFFISCVNIPANPPLSAMSQAGNF